MSTRNSVRLSTGRAVAACILAFVLLIVTQLAAVLAGEGLTQFGLPAAVGSAVSGFLYIALALLCAFAVCRKVLRLTPRGCRLAPVSLRPVWCAAALALPVLVILAFTLTPGAWQTTPMTAGQVWYTAVEAVVFYGLAAGIVEEAVFRGVIMTALERRWNKAVAVAVPSGIFAVSHVIGAELDFVSFLQLLAAGSVVGVLFSLIAIHSGSIWNSALVHAVWNMVLVGLVHIGPEANALYLWNYVMDSRSFLITGGDFGAEASAIAIAGYALFIALAALLIRRQGGKRR